MGDFKYLVFRCFKSVLNFNLEKVIFVIEFLGNLSCHKQKNARFFNYTILYVSSVSKCQQKHVGTHYLIAVCFPLGKKIP